ncbi:hypothetical protein GGX14DRAFT_568818 [Mycena pura]|uniref:AMP-dependent synthetase/ligase domain-containing protein n=1 Tax=Mycena pura TaxID=153505 RepID=A0AAD6Y8K4_9AGAR|nr:hypothetical protein GGX14DRAFT_568818 [Mycena pura]
MFTQSSTMELPWFIDAQTGRTVTGGHLKERADALARGLSVLLAEGSPTSTMHTHFDSDSGYKVRHVVGLVSPNCLDFGPVVWATHKLGCTVASINGGCTVDELTYQLSASRTRTIFAHVDCLEQVVGAALELRIPLSRIVAISDNEDFDISPDMQAKGIFTTVQLLRIGEEQPASHLDDSFSPVAFLCFSSGTTGLPKAVVIPHSAVIANISQHVDSNMPTARVVGFRTSSLMGSLVSAGDPRHFVEILPPISEIGEMAKVGYSGLGSLPRFRRERFTCRYSAMAGPQGVQHQPPPFSLRANINAPDMGSLRACDPYSACCVSGN